MKYVIIAVLIISAVVFAALSFSKKGNQIAALQVSTLPKATVFLDDKQVGKTPYYDEKLKPGEYTVKLVPENESEGFATWTGKVKLNPETLTVVNWQFGKSESASEGEILSLEALDETRTELAVLSTPNQAEVTVDSKSQGESPILLKDTKAGDHEIRLTKEGYSERGVRAKAIANYRLTVNMQLAKLETGSPSAETKLPATSSATLKKGTVVVKETPTGWLRVREEPSLNASESGRVNPGEEFPLMDEQEGWAKIEFQKGKTGWVSSQYIEKK